MQVVATCKHIPQFTRSITHLERNQPVGLIVLFFPVRGAVGEKVYDN